MVTGLSRPPLDLAFDVESQRLYWSFFDSIQAADVPAGSPIQTLVSGLQGSELLNGINGLSLGVAQTVPEPSTGLFLTTALLVSAYLQKRQA